jgi:hypothetical protein
VKDENIHEGTREEEEEAAERISFFSIMKTKQGREGARMEEAKNLSSSLSSS